jgi:CAAX protease family protein
MLTPFIQKPQLIAIFISLLFATLTLWIRPEKKFWVGFAILSLVLAVYFKYIQSMSLIYFGLFGLIMFGYYNWISKPPYKFVLGIMVFAIAWGFYAHLMPGIQNPLLYSGIKVSAKSSYYSSYLNLDKILAGVMIAGFGITFARSGKDFREAIFKAFIPAVITIALLMFIALKFKFVAWDMKFTPFVFMWVVINLFFVCLIEEVLFRGFLQTELTNILGFMKYNKLAALLLASVAFGLFHYKGGTSYMIYTAIAGLGYGWAYMRSERIEGAIFAHFMLNFVHFCFFTYPSLAR